MTKVNVRPSMADVVHVRPSRAERAGVAEVAEALSAEVTKKGISAGGNPISLFAVRQAPADELCSIGGQPGLPLRFYLGIGQTRRP